MSSYGPSSSAEALAVPSRPASTARGFWLRLYTPVVTAVLVLAVGTWLGRQAARFDPETAAQNSRVKFGNYGGEKTTSLTPVEIRLAKQVNGLSFENGHVDLLYQGNSQTVGIFDPHSGDLTSAQWLQILSDRDQGQERPVAVRMGSLPAATLADILLLALEKYDSGQHIDIIVLSLLPDEFRKSGLRDEVKESFASDQESGRVKQLLAENPDLPDAAAMLAPLMASAPAGAAKSGPTWVDSVEGRLDQFASRWPFFHYRDQLRGEVSVELLRLRNKLFHLRADKQRPVPDDAFLTSSQILELLVRVARAHNTKVVIYMGPVLPGYYSPEDMSGMQRIVAQLCEKHQLHCYDYRDLVPRPLWGADRTDHNAPGAALDYVHLPGGAHQYLAAQLFKDIHADLEKLGTQP